LPVGPGNDKHEVRKGDSLLFGIQPHTDECDIPCWKFTQEYETAGISNEFMQQVGEAIEAQHL